MYIYVDLSFQQQPDDIVVFNNATIAKVKTETPELYQIWRIDDGSDVVIQFEKERKQHNDRLVENHIYTHYSQQKQAQDQAMISRCMTKLKALHIEDVELLVMNASNDVLLDDKTLDEALTTASENIADELKPTLEKLVKCCIRNEWVQSVLDQNDFAFSDNNPVIYPEFPAL